VELISFYLLSRLGLSGLSRPRYQALQGPETYHGLRIVTPGLIRAAHERGLRVDVWTIDTEADMCRLLGYGVDGIMTGPTSWPSFSSEAEEQRTNILSGPHRASVEWHALLSA